MSSRWIVWGFVAALALGGASAFLGASRPEPASGADAHAVPLRPPRAQRTEPMAIPAPEPEGEDEAAEEPPAEPDVRIEAELRRTEDAIRASGVPEPGRGRSRRNEVLLTGSGAAVAVLCRGSGADCRSSADCCPGLACAGGVAGYGTSGRCEGPDPR